jgi:sulfur-oxidizing protein SoxY
MRHAGHHVLTRRAVLAAGAGAAGLVFAGPPQAAAAEEDRWTKVRTRHFGDRPIAEGRIELGVPPQADDAALVPMTLRALEPQTRAAYVKAIHVFVDWNPDPIVGVFRFTPESGIAHLATRIRIQTKSAVRAVAEMADGTLYMDAKVVKAAGGCSAPVGKDDLAAKRNAGQMRLRTEGDVRLGQPARAQVLIRHPQYNGLQRDIVTGGTPPPDFVTRVTARYADAVVLDADTSFAISSNPSFHFWFVPKAPGALTVRVEDTQHRVFESSLPVSPTPRG